MNNISFTTTSLCRPDITEQCLFSLKNNLIDYNLKDFTAILNVDPFPTSSNIGAQNQVLEVFQKYFKNVIYNMPITANFSNAVNWVWSAANTDYIFHLEDDWIFQENIFIDDMLKLFNCNVYQVNIRAYTYEYKNMILSPSLISKECYKKYAGKLNSKINPELQLKNKNICDFKPSHIKTYGNHPLIIDIGRAWLKKNSIERYAHKDKHKFVSYS